MTIDEALAKTDALYAAKRREMLSLILTRDGDPDVDVIDEIVAQMDASYAAERERVERELRAFAAGR